MGFYILEDQLAYVNRDYDQYCMNTMSQQKLNVSDQEFFERVKAKVIEDLTKDFEAIIIRKQNTKDYNQVRTDAKQKMVDIVNYVKQLSGLKVSFLQLAALYDWNNDPRKILDKFHDELCFILTTQYKETLQPGERVCFNSSHVDSLTRIIEGMTINGQNVSMFVSSDIEEYRAAVVKGGRYIEELHKDESAIVRQALIRKGFYIDEFLRTKDSNLLAAIASTGYDPIAVLKAADLDPGKPYYKSWVGVNNEIVLLEVLATMNFTRKTDLIQFLSFLPEEQKHSLIRDIEHCKYSVTGYRSWWNEANPLDKIVISDRFKHKLIQNHKIRNKDINTIPDDLDEDHKICYIKNGIGLENFVHDPSDKVRLVLVEENFALNILIKDKSQDVRYAVYKKYLNDKDFSLKRK